MELTVSSKKAITGPEEIVDIFETIQKTENEMDRMKEKCWEEPSSPNII